ncbi:MAG: PTS sugar transporter subunit IIA [Bacillota bacterium]|uniref:PTS sugar transporter subunit IIA n=1 Tax=Virgibacillus salarius TaxID=447199 RepID=A0A941DV38_9BACI|nr:MULTISPECIES: PTS sugar transporter subunit IIA [Bacillaceae]NAZ08768.1 PTS transporter subunit EIIA [Agaribacter marinus]MBR7796057.1 PTS sugar transporter subunit IIA [Virgibacillus salarius]MCC2252287.1 PTS sugar transporter subunit IIA [Virgibacillus sp. AGTR]MDY7045245.1 PTS sugar transporter subunit IIA [Virgibacillus sp. M23]QRZ18241.1 PTS sugar transporter subunit IIA [Virgibacillus sp. AGTR]
MKFLEENMVQFDVEVANAEEAIEAAGNLLLQQKLIESSYIQAMKQAYQTNGPYFVLAPQIAIPHARPEDGVNEASVSLVQLKKPIPFGHATNDPVRLVFGLGAASSDEHLVLLRKLTGLLNNADNINQLIHARGIADINKIIEMGR